MNFDEIRGLYEAAREKEKNNIIDWLVENNFIILNMNAKEAKNLIRLVRVAEITLHGKP